MKYKLIMTFSLEVMEKQKIAVDFENRINEQFKTPIKVIIEGTNAIIELEFDDPFSFPDEALKERTLDLEQEFLTPTGENKEDGYPAFDFLSEFDIDIKEALQSIKVEAIK